MPFFALPTSLVPAFLALLLACGPLRAAPPAAEPAPAEVPAGPDSPPPGTPPTPATEAAPDGALTEIPGPPARRREVEGTSLLFLRLTLRVKMVERELLDMSPERLVEHMQAASDILEQLRGRRLDDNEIARADRSEEYLQFLTERYVELRTGKPAKKPRKG